MNRPQLVPSLVAGVMLLVALGDLPGDYYMWLRWVVCLSAALVAGIGADLNRPRVTVPFVVLAILFNPIFPFYMSRQAWAPVDVIAAAMFFYAATLRDREEESTPQAGGPEPSTSVQRVEDEPRLEPQRSTVQHVPQEVVASVAVPSLADLTRQDRTRAVELLKVLPSQSDAFRHTRSMLNQAAADGDISAAYLAAVLCERRQDYPEARKLYAMCAEAGDTDAIWAYRRVAPSDARLGELIDAAVAAGSGEVMLQLGRERAIPGAADPSRGRTWLRRAAAAGPAEVTAEAMHALAMSFLGESWAWQEPDPWADLAEDSNATVVSDPMDFARAFPALKRAAKLGHVPAMLDLAKLFLVHTEEGDLPQTQFWLDKYLKTGGETQGLYELAREIVVSHGRESQIPVAEEWMSQYLDAGGSPAALYDLAGWLSGREEPEVRAADLRWRLQYAELGGPQALIDVALYFRYRNTELCRSLLERGARLGDSAVMVLLAEFLAEDIDPPEIDKGRGWMQRAAAAGSLEAQENLQRGWPL